LASGLRLQLFRWQFSNAVVAFELEAYGVARGMKPLAASPITAPTLEVQAFRVEPHEQVITLLIICDAVRIMAGRTANMCLSATVEIRFVTFDPAHGAFHDQHVSAS
jgi:hypothetical protein